MTTKIKIKQMKESASYTATNQMISRHSNFGRKFGDFRSVWEQRFALYCDDFGIAWEFEREGFKVKDPSGVELHYIPDFHLPKYNKYIEIVNNMSRRIKYKVFWISEQYPNVSLIIITKLDLKRMIRGIINLKDFL